MLTSNEDYVEKRNIIFLVWIEQMVVIYILSLKNHIIDTLFYLHISISTLHALHRWLELQITYASHRIFPFRGIHFASGSLAVHRSRDSRNHLCWRVITYGRSCDRLLKSRCIISDLDTAAASIKGVFHYSSHFNRIGQQFVVCV